MPWIAIHKEGEEVSRTVLVSFIVRDGVQCEVEKHGETRRECKPYLYAFVEPCHSFDRIRCCDCFP